MTLAWAHSNINSPEAETVRHIFALYREFGCARRVKEEADRLGLRTKHRVTPNGTEHGSKPFSRGHIYHLLANPIYAGQIVHKGWIYSGQHSALIDQKTLERRSRQAPPPASRNRRCIAVDCSKVSAR